MPGRFTSIIFLATCLLGRAAVEAQPPGPPGYPPYEAGGPIVYSQPNPVTANYAERGWDGTWSYGDRRNPDPEVAIPDYSPGPDGIVYDEVPGMWGFGEETPLDAAFKNVIQQTWWRLEYLSMDTTEPSAILGAEIQGNPDPTVPFAITYQGATDAVPGLETARVMDMRGISLKDLHGIRGTVGLPLMFGSIEANVFATNKVTNFKTAHELPGNPLQTQRLFVATSTFINQTPDNPIPGLNLFLYDQSFTAAFTNQVFGSEINLLLDAVNQGEGFRFRPMMGFRYFYLKERLQQVGVFSDFGNVPPITTTIDSKSLNRVYGPQFGLRTEFVHRWFTIGLDSKVTFGANGFHDTVLTDNLRSLGDPTVSTDARSWVFSPIGELQAYLRVPLNDNFSFYGGWTYIVAAKMTRADSNIFYNDNGLLEPPGVIVNPGFENIAFQSWTIGGEYRFR